MSQKTFYATKIYFHDIFRDIFVIFLLLRYTLQAETNSLRYMDYDNFAVKRKVINFRY